MRTAFLAVTSVMALASGCTRAGNVQSPPPGRRRSLGVSSRLVRDD